MRNTSIGKSWIFVVVCELLYQYQYTLYKNWHINHHCHEGKCIMHHHPWTHMSLIRKQNHHANILCCPIVKKIHSFESCTELNTWQKQTWALVLFIFNPNYWSTKGLFLNFLFLWNSLIWFACKLKINKIIIFIWAWKDNFAMSFIELWQCSIRHASQHFSIPVVSGACTQKHKEIIFVLLVLNISRCSNACQLHFFLQWTQRKILWWAFGWQHCLCNQLQWECCCTF